MYTVMVTEGNPVLHIIISSESQMLDFQVVQVVMESMLIIHGKIFWQLQLPKIWL